MDQPKVSATMQQVELRDAGDGSKAILNLDALGCVSEEVKD